MSASQFALSSWTAQSTNFSHEDIKHIYISKFCNTSYFSNSNWSGHIDFENKSEKFTKRFEADQFDELVRNMQKFLSTYNAESKQKNHSQKITTENSPNSCQEQSSKNVQVAEEINILQSTGRNNKKRKRNRKH